MGRFFVTNDFDGCWHKDKATTYQDVTKKANEIIVSMFEPVDKETKTIELWILVDNFGRIYYTNGNKEVLESYKNSMTDGQNLNLVKLEGALNV